MPGFTVLGSNNSLIRTIFYTSVLINFNLILKTIDLALPIGVHLL